MQEMPEHAQVGVWSGGVVSRGSSKSCNGINWFFFFSGECAMNCPLVKHVSNCTRDNNQFQCKQKALIHSNALLTLQRMRAQNNSLLTTADWTQLCIHSPQNSHCHLQYLLSHLHFCWHICAYTDLRLNLNKIRNIFLPSPSSPGELWKG